MGDLIAAHHGEWDAPGADELLAGIVRALMADRRARLSPGDATREESGAEVAPGAPRGSPEATVPAREHPPEHPARA